MTKPTNAREVAAFTLFDMLENGAWSEGALHHYLQLSGLSGRDAALAARLAYGTLQNRSMCDFYIRKYSKIRLAKIKPRVLELMRMGVYQLTMLDRIPAHAATSETIKLIRKYGKADERAAGFANGVLRSIARDKENNKLPHPDCPDKESYYALKYTHPEWLMRKLSSQYGQKESQKIAQANNEIAPISVRINSQKITKEQVYSSLIEDGFTAEYHPTMNNILLCSGGDIAQNRLFIDGKITVQDAASAAAVEVLEPKPDMKIIDCCAAPGGKTFYIAEKMQNKGQLISCDIYEHKLKKIEEGAKRLGFTCIKTRLANSEQYQPEFEKWADVVMCDVPCSGLGIIRKKPEIRFKTDEELASLPQIQANILRNCANYVKIGGTIVYSTCTILQRENQDVVNAFLKENNNFVLEPFNHPVCGQTDGMITLLPHLHKTDGFFIAKLRRKS